MLIWGVLLVLGGLGLLTAQGWARWFTIVVVALNFLAQLGFLGNSSTRSGHSPDGAEHHRPLRADRALEREQGRAQPPPSNGRS